jgi:HAD superfamily hydrolase (TIGR01509 family)
VKTALLFDLDGTLVNTDALHLTAFQSVFARHGVALSKTQYVEGIMGYSNSLIGARFLPHLSPAEREAAVADKEAAYRDMVGALAPVAGALALLDFADSLGIKCAVVTNAPRANAQLVLNALGLGERLPIQIIGPELARAKPDPMPYLAGLQETGADAAHSIAFEDSLSGLRAALGAGLTVVGMTTALEEAALQRAGAAIAVADFTDPRIVELIRHKMACTNNGGP